MGWLGLAAGAILLLFMLSFVAEFGVFLFATHQTCAATSTTASSNNPSLFGVTSNATTGAAAPLTPVPMVAADLALSPLADLSLIPSHGNGTALADLTDPGYWQLVHASEFQTYEQILPQTVLGFFNSSQEWRVWALQHIPESRNWMAVGFVTVAKGQVMAVDPGSASPRGDDSTAIAHGVREFAVSAAGLTLASLDFVSFNGVTALKVLFETHDLTLAACQTLPGQLAQLYESSFDPAVPKDVRAQYLGRALAITSVMLLVGGKDGFADRFKTAVEGVGLGDSWPAIKPYLGDIASKASARASSATFAVLQTLAQRFPQDSAWVTGLTADRVDSMVEVLHGKGISDGAIQDGIKQVANAAGTASDEQVPGEAADALSIQQGGGELLKVKAQNKIVRYDDGNGRTANIRGTFLQGVIPGFEPRGPNLVQIHYQEAHITAYHSYESKAVSGEPIKPSDTEWNPRAPGVVGKPGDIVTASFELLTTDKFLKSVSPIEYLNIGRESWVSGFSEVRSLQLVGDQVQMSVRQEPLEGVSSFVVDGKPNGLENSNGNTFLTFSIPNIVDEPRMLKVTFNGYGDPLLSVSSGTNFNPITSICSDGIRLKIVSDSGGTKSTISTLYLREPSLGWKLGTISEGDIGFPVSGAYKTFRINQVSGTRGIENGLSHSFSKIDLGRAGAEIAYTVAQQKFHLEGLRLYEITQGGKDLDTRDGSVVIQARMLANPDDLSPANMRATLGGQMNNLVEKLKEDFANNDSATTGYAILSYLDPSTNTISTLIAEVLRQ